jgi:ubiquinone/menaquinone biosynthesis C-methylase UbiE
MASRWNPEGRAELDVETGYRMWADGYDVESNALILVEEPVVDRMLEGIAVRDALDAATGTGRYALRLAARGARVTAIDASAEMLAIAKRKAQAAGRHIRFERGRIDERLPFADASFDLVTCALALCHFASHEGVDAEFARVLRPGGHLVITDFHPAIVAAGARTTFGRDGKKYLLPNPPLTREDYIGAVRKAGLEVLEVVEVPLTASPPGTMSEVFLETFRELPLCLIVFARKPEA